LRAILSGLEKNRLLENVAHLLTGYIGSESFLNAILEVLTILRKYSKVRFVCDPVLGDKGSFYVTPDLVHVYRDKVIPLADVVTPNQFEVEQLTGVVILTLEDAKRACNILLDMGPSLVFITSLDFKTNSDIVDIGNPIITILSAQRQKSGQDEYWRIDSPLFNGSFTGTGDLAAALLLGHTANSPDDLKGCMEKVASTMHLVIKRTFVASASCDSISSRELQLIASKKDIEDPPILFQAYKV
jgi:pyridoxine kinase